MAWKSFFSSPKLAQDNPNEMDVVSYYADTAHMPIRQSESAPSNQWQLMPNTFFIFVLSAMREETFQLIFGTRSNRHGSVVLK